ncbi:guanine nucleotide binding protein, alpha subunit [Lentinula aciculospora]|uniref:Guanine nucleotide binding protein, alpha subunit n=1 Tax=Lentinula aciculospora TaxID=153920 RepID=A0A9W9DGW7_9AGAR|nr:guanine nucleotide binding protein, alpha subunit [Lentinula aciculospora]
MIHLTNFSSPPPGETNDERVSRLVREEEALKISMAIDASIKAERQGQEETTNSKASSSGQSESGVLCILFSKERILWRAVIQLNIVRPGSNGYSNDVSDLETDPEDQRIRSCLGPEEIDALKLRLLPLRHIEALLIAKLVPPNEEEATRLAAPTESRNTYPPSHLPRSSYKTQEIFVRPGPGWKGGLARARVWETSDEPQEVLNACRTDIMRLWADRGVKELLHRRRIRLEEFPGFFLNDLERVTSLKYIPTDDDVLKARLKTVGVSEYRFQMEVSTGRETGTDWRIVDVGGSRSQPSKLSFWRQSAVFDQVLTEDRTVNRLEDSVLLWKTVCTNKLLAKVDLVLFLNKCDILESKLKAGVRLAKYVKSFGDRTNNLETVSKSKFSAIHREYSPNPRKFYAFCTSVTVSLRKSFRDMVIREHLKQSKLM